MASSEWRSDASSGQKEGTPKPLEKKPGRRLYRSTIAVLRLSKASRLSRESAPDDILEAVKSLPSPKSQTKQKASTSSGNLPSMIYSMVPTHRGDNKTRRATTTETTPLQTAPDTPPRNSEAKIIRRQASAVSSNGRRELYEYSRQTSPDVKALHQQLIQSRLESLSPKAIGRVSKVVSELDDSEPVEDSQNDHNTNMFKSLDPCLHRTWAIFNFCVLEPAMCLIRTICNDKKQPGSKHTKGNNHASNEAKLQRSPSSLRSIGGLMIASRT